MPSIYQVYFGYPVHSLRCKSYWYRFTLALHAEPVAISVFVAVIQGLNVSVPPPTLVSAGKQQVLKICVCVPFLIYVEFWLCVRIPIMLAAH